YKNYTGRTDKLSSDFLLAPSTRVPKQAPLKIESVHREQVLTRGADGAWDDNDLLGPSVLRFNGKLFNYYSAYDGATWRMGVATSDDGVTWKKYERNPVLQPTGNDWDVTYIAANGSAILWQNQIYYYYQGTDA